MQLIGTLRLRPPETDEEFRRAGTGSAKLLDGNAAAENSNWHSATISCVLSIVRNALTNWRGVLGRVSPPIGQPLVAHAVRGDAGALFVMAAQTDAFVVAEAEFVEGAL